VGLQPRRNLPPISHRLAAIERIVPMRGALATLATLAIVVGIVAVAGAVGQGQGLEQHSYIAGLVATFVGVACGLPVALWFDRWKVGQEKRKQDAEERARKFRVMQLLEEELSADLRALGARANTPWTVEPPYLISNVWAALSASGEIRGLDAPLLADTAQAYARIEATAPVERQLFESEHDPVVRSTGWDSVQAALGQPSPVVALRSTLSRMDGQTKVAIDAAIQHLRSAASLLLPGAVEEQPTADRYEFEAPRADGPEALPPR
jgi:hypothetical protein